jgi:hypothetical protein
MSIEQDKLAKKRMEAEEHEVAEDKELEVDALVREIQSQVKKVDRILTT